MKRPLMANDNGTGRLDRIERALELLIDDHVQFREEHKMLLTAQVVLTDRVDKLIVRMDQLTSRVDQLTGTVEKLAASVGDLRVAVDGLVKYVMRLPPPSPKSILTCIETGQVKPKPNDSEVLQP